MFDDNFCLNNRFYDNSIDNRKQNELYLFVQNFQSEIVESISNLNEIDVSSVLELETYATLNKINSIDSNDGEKFSVIKSNFFLHKLENINLVLQNIKKTLKPNGLFYGTFFGSENLKNFAINTLNVQQKLCQQIYPMVLPTIDIKILGMMLKSIGFKNPSVVSIKKDFNFKLINDMLKFSRTIGGTNCLINRRKSALPKTFFNQLIDIEDGLTLKFEILVFICQN